MNLKRFKVMSFDVVGTLMDFEGGMLDYLHKVMPGGGVDDEAFLAGYRQSRASSKLGWYPDDIARVWHELAPQFGLPDGPGIAEGFRDSVSVWKPFPDSVDALRRLAARFKLVAMTNTQRWAMTHFDRALGYPFFDIVCCDDAMCEKPDPKFFAFTRGRLSVRGFGLADTLHVAQSQYHDIGVARSLGYTVCWIERRAGQQGFGGTQSVEQLTQPDFHFRTLAELADAVDACPDPQ